MKLYLVHCGYYDPKVCDGVYESHVNFFVVAESFEDARVQAKKNPLFRDRRMHIDGLQQLDAISGYRVVLEQDTALDGRTQIESSRFRNVTTKTQPAKPSLH